MHQILDEARDILAEGDTDVAMTVVLDFAGSQIGEPGRHGRKFRDIRNELIALSARIARLRRTRRRALESADRLEREERRIDNALIDLVEEIDRFISRSSAPAPAVPPPIDMAMPEAGVPEKIVGRDNLRDFAWLQRGSIAGRAVCRVKAPGSIGTGFLIAGGYVVTNNHVIPDADAAAGATVEFNYERDESGQMKPSTLYRVDASEFASAPVPDDISILKIVDSGADPPLSHWGTLTIERRRPVRVGEPVAIIQHPSGGDKHIAVTDNEVVAVEAPQLLYRTDTKPGSSGSPVFDENWKVVALHRAGGVRTRDAAGKTLFANQGVMMSHLCDLSSIAGFLNRSP